MSDNRKFENQHKYGIFILMNKRHFFFILLLLHQVCFGQRSNQIPYSSAEKIYLQLDGQVYTNDNTIWFKCIVSNAFDLSPSNNCGVLYVELIGSNEFIIQKKTIKIDNGIGDGYFELNEQMAEGTYMVRAYSNWSKNFGDNFYFEEYVRVYSSSDKNPELVKKIDVLKVESGHHNHHHELESKIFLLS